MIGRGIAAGADENLNMVRFGAGDIGCLGKGRIVDWHVAEAEELLSLLADHVDNDLLVVINTGRIARHEDVANGIFASFRQGHTLARHFLAEKAVGDLHENARTIAHQRISADSTAMRQVFKNEQAVLDDLVGFLTLHMGNKADAAGIVLIARIVKTLLFRQAARETPLRRNGCGRSRGGTVSGQGGGCNLCLRLVHHFCPSCKITCMVSCEDPARHEFSLPAKSVFNPARSNLGQQSCLNSRGF
ncbi:hypothetical protein D3C80_154850 [compost metagenome]